MAANIPSQLGEQDVIIDINTTPLIDVLLVLLVMLIITIPIQTHAVKLDMPRPDRPPPLIEPEIVTLEIDFDGTPIWNGNPVPDRATLNGYLRRAAIADPQPEIHLRPDRLVKYGTVARVLADAQRLGVTHIGFVGTEQYEIPQ
jgi:biopolymer transport protein ExbD